MNKLNTVATVLVALLTLVDVGHNIGIVPTYIPASDPVPTELQLPMQLPPGSLLLANACSRGDFVIS